MVRGRHYTRIEVIILGAIGPLCLIVLWEAAARLNWMDAMLISSPTSVMKAMVTWALNGTLWRDLGVSLMETFIGFATATIVGISVGAIIGWKKPIEYALDPFIWFLYTTPLVSLWPLFIMWLGFGYQPIIALAFLFAVVPITINAFTGFRGVDPILIRCAHSFNAKPFDMFLKFTLPAALPMIIAGLRLGVGRALIGVIIGELFSANEGLGFHISYYGARLNFSFVFAGLFVVVVVGLLLTQTIRVVEMYFEGWKM